MSSFKVNTQKLRDTGDQEQSTLQQLNEIYDQIINENRRVSYKVAGAGNIRWRLNQVANAVNAECKTLSAMQSKLIAAANAYEKTENRISDVIADGQVTTWEKLKSINWKENAGKTVLKTLMEITTKAGSLGGSFSWLTSIIGINMDNDGISPKDIGKLIKDGGNSILKWNDLIKQWNNGEFDKILGLDTYKTLKPIASGTQVSWADAYSKTFKDAFDVSPVEAGKKFNGAKVAGWGLALAANGFSNYEEYKSGKISGYRAFGETAVETGIDIAKGAAITAAVAAGAAALGVAAPAVVVAGAGVVVSAGLDFVCKKVTGAVLGEEKSLTETVSDFVIDRAVDVMQEATAAVSSKWNAMCSWGASLGFC